MPKLWAHVLLIINAFSVFSGFWYLLSGRDSVGPAERVWHALYALQGCMASGADLKRRLMPIPPLLPFFNTSTLFLNKKRAKNTIFSPDLKKMVKPLDRRVAGGGLLPPPPRYTPYLQGPLLRLDEGYGALYIRSFDFKTRIKKIKKKKTLIIGPEQLLFMTNKKWYSKNSAVAMVTIYFTFETSADCPTPPPLPPWPLTIVDISANGKFNLIYVLTNH